MEILFILIAVSVVLTALVASVFLWAVRAGQFDDLDSPAWRILTDDDPPGEKPEAPRDER